MAAGIRPNIALAKDAGLACGRGIRVDDGMLTSDPSIFAVGECVEHRGALFGLVAPLYEMAKIVADRVTHSADSAYVPAVTGTRLKVTGIDMFSSGDFIGDDNTDDLVFRDSSRGVHKRLVIRDDRLIGAVLYGDAGDSAWYFDHIRNGTAISALRDMLVFGPDAGNADSHLPSESPAHAMAGNSDAAVA
jgi:nitrite reductase (NADH) large subunit